MDILKSWRGSKNYRKWSVRTHEKLEQIEEEIQIVAQQLKSHGISSINPSSTIHPTAIVGKDVIVGKNVKIGPYCYIRDNVILDDDVFLGYGIEISNSVILCGTQIHHSAFIGNSVIGEDCNLGAWFVTSTRRLVSRQLNYWTSL